MRFAGDLCTVGLVVTGLVNDMRREWALHPSRHRQTSRIAPGIVLYKRASHCHDPCVIVVVFRQDNNRFLQKRQDAQYGRGECLVANRN